MKSDISTKVKHGLKWNMLNRVVSQLIFVWFGIYLARLIGPEAYGLVGMITVFSGFANIFVDFGFSSSVIYFQNLNQNKLSSIFWFNLFTSIVIYVIFYLMAPLLGDFYNEPRVSSLTRIISVSIIIYSLTSLQNALLTKNLTFKLIITGSWVSIIVSYIVGFYLAYNNYGVMSLVMQTIVQSSVYTVFLWFASKWKPSFYFSFRDLKSMMGYGSNVAGTNMLGYLTRNLDNLVIGKFLGEIPLGLYTRSYSLMMLPITNISAIFSKVMFPAFSSMQDDKEKLKNYYLIVVKYIALIIFPLMFGFSAVAEEFVLLFLGPDWKAAIQLIQILSLLGAFQSILSLNGVIFNSTGNSKKGLYTTLIFNLFLIPAWMLGIYLDGIKGMVISYALVGTFGILPILNMALRCIDLKIMDLVNKLKGIIISSSIMMLTIYFVNSYLSFGILINLVAKICLGISIYLLLLIFLDKEILLQVYLKIKLWYEKNIKKSV